MELIKSDLIWGQRFQELANIIIDDAGDQCDGENKDIGKYPIVYTHTYNANKLFQWLSRKNEKYIVITHNSDGKVKSEGEAMRVNSGSSNDVSVKDITPNTVYWYSQNVCAEHPRLQSLPIGLENPHWFEKIGKMDRMIERIEGCRKSERTRLAYMNYNVYNNPNERQPLFRKFARENWVTAELKKNPQDFVSYLENLIQHRFVFSPEGNGTDCHRPWEALYMGCIPILKRNFHTNHYEGKVAAMFVDDWNEVTEESLNNFKCDTALTQNLYWKYWDNKIRNAK